MKRTLLFVLALLAPCAGLWAAPQATFTSVSGKVTVTDVKGKISRPAQMGATVVEGERVSAAASAQAALRLFDGSVVTVSPGTTFTVEKLQQPGLKDKVIQFRLEFGKLLAAVKKLTTSKSSFEIEAGGVVCGVRGTEYWMEYNPSTGKIDVFVTDGTVWSTDNGQTEILHGGQGGSWVNGTWTPNPPPGGSGNPSSGSANPPPSSGNNQPGFIASNPFYGFNGTDSDDFNNPLGGPTGGLNGVTGNVDNNGVASLNAHLNLNLQLNFPQYLP